ncbi:MAG: PIN domain-containing protein [Caulobacteraceae bacterium]|nr:PIN domain-containing protein [Caulobacteraceae bacterium]
MKGRVFLDTNVLIYAAASDEVFPRKFAIAGEILATEDFATSTQVLGEFIRNVQSPRKMTVPLSDDEIDGWLDRLFEFPVIAIDQEVVLSAAFFQRRYQIQYFDGQIIAAAHRFGAQTLLSEDLSHGQTYGSVRCENPFREH